MRHDRAVLKIEVDNEALQMEVQSERERRQVKERELDEVVKKLSGLIDSGEGGEDWALEGELEFGGGPGLLESGEIELVRDEVTSPVPRDGFDE
jgi:hypothetical protein